MNFLHIPFSYAADVEGYEFRAKVLWVHNRSIL
jgi:hypothetical protein